jgi:hypothetical protein
MSKSESKSESKSMEEARRLSAAEDEVRALRAEVSELQGRLLALEKRGSPEGRRAGGRKSAKEPVRNPARYGWRGRDVCALVTCVQQGADPEEVVRFMESRALPKDLAAFKAREWPDPELLPKPTRDALEKLKISVESHFDRPEKGVKGFSSTVVRKANALRGLCDKADPESTTARLMPLATLLQEVCVAQKDVLTNGPPTESPPQSPCESGLSLRVPVIERQVHEKPLRLQREAATKRDTGTESLHVFAKEEPEEEDPVPEEHEEEDDETKPENGALDEEDNEEEEEDDDDMPAEPADRTLDSMETTFEELVYDEWGTAWQKCHEFPSLFGTHTNARGVMVIFARVTGDQETDKKKYVLAKVAHGAIAFSHNGQKVALCDLA